MIPLIAAPASFRERKEKEKVGTWTRVTMVKGLGWGVLDISCPVALGTF